MLLPCGLPPERDEDWLLHHQRNLCSALICYRSGDQTRFTTFVMCAIMFQCLNMLRAAHMLGVVPELSGVMIRKCSVLVWNSKRMCISSFCLPSAFMGFIHATVSETHMPIPLWKLYFQLCSCYWATTSMVFERASEILVLKWRITDTAVNHVTEDSNNTEPASDQTVSQVIPAGSIIPN
jgi:hypothetical protein